MAKAVLVIVALALAGGGVYWYWTTRGGSAMTYRTERVKRDNLLVTISATGTVEPEEVVDVGAQVAGQILRFGDDTLTPADPERSARLAKVRPAPKGPQEGLKEPDSPDSPPAQTQPAAKRVVDYGSIVDVGTLLAQIDDSLYVASRDASLANLESARADRASAVAAKNSADAAVTRAKADLEQMKAKLSQAQKDWGRAKELGANSQALAQTQYDAYEAAYKIAQANVNVGEAAIVQAIANAEQAAAAIGRADASILAAQAALKKDLRNLSFCEIRSPVKGVIIDRRVNIGQTVVSSLNAPSLFLIAKDLKRMEIWVAVNEADIGSIYEGQPVTFTADMFPDRVFEGRVEKVRLNATMTQSVVTYTVDVSTDNSDGKLANVSFETARRSDVLVVPNAALRWSPSLEQVVAEARAAYEAELNAPETKGKGARGEGSRKLAASKPASSPSTEPEARGAAARGKKGRLWVRAGAFVTPVPVRVGLSDGTVTEVTGPEVKEGMDVVVGVEAASAAGDAGRSPFTPQMPGRNRPSGSGR
ncbi:MAG: HlyD family efflux transporter periplasmic adaptor subunit [Planctomycetota bacterium]|nr:HlyD family efflux transporter periplasmic adaptor subunit [Planctomycetota bacterium]